MSDAELSELQELLEAIPAPFEALDISMLDGYLCGVLLQPRVVPVAQWFAHVIDVDGRRVPPSPALQRVHSLVLQRHAELERAIAERQWFDPWVYELADASPSESVMPWVAGFATAMELFPALLQLESPALLEPLATLYAHIDPEDLEDADELLAEIETLEPPQDLTEAVEGLVRSTLLLADVGRPSSRPPRPVKRHRKN